MHCADFAAIRAAFVAQFDQVCAVVRDVTVSDGAGGETRTVAVVASGVACLVTPQGFTREERLIAERLTATKLWSIALPVDTDVQAQDRIITADARTYEVVNTTAGESMAIVLHVTCVRLGKG